LQDKITQLASLCDPYIQLGLSEPEYISRKPEYEIQAAKEDTKCTICSMKGLALRLLDTTN